MNDTRAFEIFLEVQRGLPRQGPGDDASTRRALALCGDLPDNPVIIDVGCGPGMQTRTLAQAVGGHILAIDLHREYLVQLRESLPISLRHGTVDLMIADMNALPLRHESVDLIWSEGAAYSIGFENALIAWRPFLKHTGCIAVSELVWLQPDPPPEAAAFFASEYPPMTNIPTNLAAFERSGYTVLGHFSLPDDAWWTHYYTPLDAKLDRMRRRYAGDVEALDVIETTAREIDTRRRFASAYGYEFFVARKTE